MNALASSSRARITSVCDADRSRTEQASKLGARVQSFPEILADPEVEVIEIATPNKYHALQVLAALDAGKFVWCEKPLAPTVEECRTILQAAKEHPRRVKVGSNVRFFPNILKLKELIISSSIGTPLLFRGYIGNAGRHLKENSWYTRQELVGGGTLLDNGVHLVDLIRWLLGEIDSCHAIVSNSMWHLNGLEDLAMCMFHLSGGARASIQSSWHEWSGYLYVEIYGSEGFIRSDNRFSTAKLTVGNREKILQEYDYSHLPPVSYANELNNFIDCHDSSREFEPSAYDGYRVVRVIRACYESALSGNVVDCSEK